MCVVLNLTMVAIEIMLSGSPPQKWGRKKKERVLYMFDRPGEKIKNFALIFFVLMVLGGLISAIALMANESFFLGLGVLLGTALSAYLSSLFLSGFGELIQSSEENEAHNREILAILKNGGASNASPAAPAAPAPAAKEQTPASSPASGAPESGVRLANGRWRCVCGTENAEYVSSCSCGRRKRDVIK